MEDALRRRAWTLVTTLSLLAVAPRARAQAPEDARDRAPGLRHGRERQQREELAAHVAHPEHHRAEAHAEHGGHARHERRVGLEPVLLERFPAQLGATSEHEHEALGHRASVLHAASDDGVDRALTSR